MIYVVLTSQILYSIFVDQFDLFKKRERNNTDMEYSARRFIGSLWAKCDNTNRLIQLTDICFNLNQKKIDSLHYLYKNNL
jgi:hypothetical protein